MKRLLFLLACFIFVTGCQAINENIPNANESDIPNDFNFKINFGVGGINCIDTYNNTFTKDLVISGAETIDFIIPADKMRELFGAFMAYEISELPDNINSEIDLNVDGQSYVSGTPSNLFSLTYTCDGKTRTVVCDDGGPWYADTGAPDTCNRLVEFVKLITEYVYSTEEYQNMSPAEGAYL